MRTENCLPRSLCSYEVAVADNGYIFSYYDVTTDYFHSKLAKSPQELGDIITTWQADRVVGIIAHLAAKDAVSNG